MRKLGVLEAKIVGKSLQHQHVKKYGVMANVRMEALHDSTNYLSYLSIYVFTGSTSRTGSSQGRQDCKYHFPCSVQSIDDALYRYSITMFGCLRHYCHAATTTSTFIHSFHQKHLTTWRRSILWRWLGIC